jgi:VanZ family protein
MGTAQRQRWSRAKLLALVLSLYWLMIFAATHLPLRNVRLKHVRYLGNLVLDSHVLDKVAHVGAFAGLAFLLTWLGKAAGGRRWKLFAGVLGLAAAYGIFDETTQALVRDRTPDVLDWLADMVGAWLGIIGFVVVRRTYLWMRGRPAI